MAQTKKKRRRKHRGTQGGAIETRGSARSRPRTRGEAKAIAEQRRAAKRSRVPTWRGAAGRAGVAALFFVLLVTLILKQKLVPSLILGVAAFAIYVPVGYYVDQWVYKRTQRRKEEAARSSAAKRSDPGGAPAPSKNGNGRSKDAG